MVARMIQVGLRLCGIIQGGRLKLKMRQTPINPISLTVATEAAWCFYEQVRISNNFLLQLDLRLQR